MLVSVQLDGVEPNFARTASMNVAIGIDEHADDLCAAADGRDKRRGLIDRDVARALAKKTRPTWLAPPATAAWTVSGVDRPQILAVTGMGLAIGVRRAA